MKNLALFLRLRLRMVPGLRIELKQATVAVHYREAAPEEHSVGQRVILQLVRESEDLRLMLGKKVWEILPAGPVDKCERRGDDLETGRSLTE
jgi:trehalose-phosphatase